MAKGSKEIELEGFDRVFPIVGGHHRFQWMLFAIVSMQACFLAFHGIGYVFLGAIPDHWCDVQDLKNTNWTAEQIKNISIPRGDDGKFEKCVHFDLNFTQLGALNDYLAAVSSIDYSLLNKKPCSRWAYDESIYKSTVVTQFDLVCDRHYLAATIQATYMIGIFVGSLTISGLSDRILGRRLSVMIAEVLIIVFGFGAVFSTSYPVFIICRFFIAIGVAGSCQNCFTLLMEYVDTSSRAKMGVLMQIPFAIGYMVMPLYAYFIRDWSSLQMAFVATALPLLTYYWTLPESSRWLATKGKEDRATSMLLRIAKINKKANPDLEVLQGIVRSCRDRSPSSDTVDPIVKVVPRWKRICHGMQNFLGNYWKLVKTPELRKRSILLWILYISVTLVYYGVTFDSALLTSDPFLLVFLGGLMEIPGYLMVIPFASRFGRASTVSASFLLAGTSILVISVTPIEFETIRVIFAMSGKLFISGCFSITFLLGTELYPTTTRATGLGAAVLMGRFGSILAPFIVNQMKNVYSDMPSIIFGVTGIIAGVIAIWLPETKNDELVESVQAIEARSLKCKTNVLNRQSSVDDEASEQELRIMVPN